LVRKDGARRRQKYEHSAVRLEEVTNIPDPLSHLRVVPEPLRVGERQHCVFTQLARQYKDLNGTDSCCVPLADNLSDLFCTTIVVENTCNGARFRMFHNQFIQRPLSKISTVI